MVMHKEAESLALRDRIMRHWPLKLVNAMRANVAHSVLDGRLGTPKRKVAAPPMKNPPRLLKNEIVNTLRS